MPDIKVKGENKGIMAIDKAATLTERMKTSAVKTKEKAENGYYQDTTHDTPEEYAVDDAQQKTETAVRNTVHYTKRTVKKGTKKVIDKFRQNRAKKYSAKPEYTDLSIRPSGSSSGSKAVQNPRLKEPAEKTIKTATKTVKQTGKGTVKTAQKSVKTAEKTSKAAIKTTQQAAKTAQKTAKAAEKAARRSAQAARETAKATARTIKAVAKAIVAAAKAIIAGIKALIAAIAAGGWVAVLVIVLICLVALIAGSCFGVFYSNEESPDSISMKQAVEQLNDEYYEKIESIRADTKADVVDIISNDEVQSINWKEVIAVFAVKTTSVHDGVDVATITNDKIELLRNIMWDMNGITSDSKSATKTVDAIETDSSGKEIVVKKSIVEVVLTINLTHKSYSDMIDIYSFDSNQTEQLELLMSDEYDSMWSELLGGYTSGSGEIIITNSDRIPNYIFSWPLPESFTITSKFGYRSDPFTGATKYHGGVDISAPNGTPILAAADGTVIVANSTDSWGGSYGYYVKIRHNDTEDTLYAHCSSIAVSKGQQVSKGQVIAYVGSTGNSTGNHLHFEVYVNETRTNPLRFFN